MPKISVVIPCYNHGRYIDEAVNSILNQTYQDFEIIIVDDGSTDPFTVQKLKTYLKPKTTVVHIKNQGPSAARNAGVKLAKGDYILTLDADDLFDVSFLEKAITVLEQQPQVGVVTCGIQHVGASKKKVLPQGGGVENFLAGNGVLGSAFFRKICWEEAGGYDESMKDDNMGYEDWNFWIDVTKRGWTVYVIPEYLFYYRIHKVSRRTKAHSNRPQVIKKIVSNHREIFAKYVEKVVFEKEQKIYSLNQAKNTILNSWSYRLGSFLLFPVRQIKKLFHR